MGMKCSYKGCDVGMQGNYKRYELGMRQLQGCRHGGYEGSYKRYKVGRYKGCSYKRCKTSTKQLQGVWVQWYNEVGV